MSAESLRRTLEAVFMAEYIKAGSSRNIHRNFNYN